MESDDCRCARLATEAVMNLLNRRKGFAGWWDGVHSEAQEDIQHKMYLAVLEVVRETMVKEGTADDTR